MAVKLAFCYAHEDKRMATRLKKHLKVLQQSGFIDVWGDYDILAGNNWKLEIKQHLSNAQIILLLLSADFMDSDYCYDVEMKQAVARHERGEARVIPILLRAFRWQGTSISELKMLPEGEKPIALWAPQDTGYESVAKGIEEVVRHWFAYNLANPTEERKIMLVGFSKLIEAVKAQMQPPPRAQHTVGTLQQLSMHIPDGVMLADLLAGWQELSHPRSGDEVAVIARRNTCRELAEIAAQFTDDQGSLAGAFRAWQAWQEVFEGSSDSRQAAMAATFAREVAELRSVR
jgi:hypothetical protein